MRGPRPRGVSLDTKTRQSCFYAGALADAGIDATGRPSHTPFDSVSSYCNDNTGPAISSSLRVRLRASSRSSAGRIGETSCSTGDCFSLRP
jgi:hypothetical protein